MVHSGPVRCRMHAFGKLKAVRIPLLSFYPPCFQLGLLYLGNRKLRVVPPCRRT